MAGAKLRVGSPLTRRLIDKCLRRPGAWPTQLSTQSRPTEKTGAERYVPDRRKDFQGTDAHKEKLEEDYHLLHRQPTASPDNRRQSIFTSRDTLDRFVAPGSPQNNPTLTMSTAELASSYAALILADEGVEITVREKPNPRSDPPPVSRSCRIPP